MLKPAQTRASQKRRITSYNVCYTKLLRDLGHVVEVLHRDEVLEAVDRAQRNGQRQHHREARVDRARDDGSMRSIERMASRMTSSDGRSGS